MQNERPISPHLQIYRPTITMMMSIAHRITGIGLYFGSPLIVLWMSAIALKSQSLKFIVTLIESPIGTLFLIAYSWALIHHAMGGIRHFIWDAGYGFDENRPRYTLHI